MSIRITWLGLQVGGKQRMISNMHSKFSPQRIQLYIMHSNKGFPYYVTCNSTYHCEK